MEIKEYTCIRINAPEFFEREDFQEFLNRGTFHGGDGNETVATWHAGGQPGQGSDLFVTYDNGEGSDALPEGSDKSDANLIPQDIWDKICDRLEAEGIDHALLWITNLETDID